MGTPPDQRKRAVRDKIADPRFYLRAVIVVCAMALIALPLTSDVFVTSKTQNTVTGCRVVHVTDGDTVRLYCSGRGFLSGRLTGFDTPELFSPRCFTEFAMALRAKWALRWLLLTTEDITVVREGTDRYDRALIFLAADGVPVARTMIERGHARAYDGDRRKGWCDALQGNAA
ncbi:thermonuclease family protein [uncultured Roseovarius sp.]|uniref:thermonuclease family protein n=1 Tax=uncultured Roseovarius sp. TaxID=293344 RepID=UPI0026080B15|nr:thermonuclease family protein [uncultured Roseovarius sp.]